MSKIVNTINNGNIEVIAVGDDAVQCDVTGMWFESAEELAAHKQHLASLPPLKIKVMRDVGFGILEKQGIKLNQTAESIQCSIRVRDLIDELQKLNPDDMIVTEDEGCNKYCEMYKTPKQMESIDNIRLYSIGRAIKG